MTSSRVKWATAIAVVAALGACLAGVGGCSSRGASSACGGETPAKAGGGHWSCSFDAEFDGTRLDRSKWQVVTTRATGYRNGPECYVDDPANVSVSGGNLVLSARRVEGPTPCSGPRAAGARQYTGGMVSTRDHFGQTYGRFEIRAAFPGTTVTGVHSAVWLWPQALTYGGRGASGEIDLVEYYSGVAPDVGYATLKYNTIFPRKWTTVGCRLTDPAAFHTYTLVWTSSLVTISYDGHTCLSTQWQPAAPLHTPEPFDHRFNIDLTQALGQGNIAMSPDLAFPVTMKVDYVRAWK